MEADLRVVPDHEPVGARAASWCARATTLRPIRLASIRSARSLTREPERMIECSTSERSIVTSVVDRRVRARRRSRRCVLPAPMIVGPRTVERSSVAPASITTRPSTRRVRRSSPSMRGTRSSRIRRLASSRSSSWPVSFHQPRTMCGSTRRPRSISVWIASVISSSSRHEGSIDAGGVEDHRREHVDADQREVGRRVLRLLDQALDRGRRPARRRRSARGRARA